MGIWCPLANLAYWRRDVAQGIRQDAQSNYANPSPITDGNLAISEDSMAL